MHCGRLSMNLSVYKWTEVYIHEEISSIKNENDVDLKKQNIEAVIFFMGTYKKMDILVSLRIMLYECCLYTVGMGYSIFKCNAV